jgi:hypothetical protein
MIEGRDVKKHVCDAVREVARHARTEEAAREFVDEVHAGLDEMLEALCAKRSDDWRNAPVADSDLAPPKKRAAAEPDGDGGKKKAAKKKAG